MVEIAPTCPIDNMPGVYQVKVNSNIEISSNVFLMSLLATEIAGKALPGNFINVKIDSSEVGIWRRPFSILDTEQGNIRILYKTFGKGTKIMSGYPQGFLADIIGPLGNSFSLPDKDDTILLAGGGIGVPPLYFLSKHLINEGTDPRQIHFFNGATDHESLVFIEESAELGINTYAVTEDGSMGIEGIITVGVEQFIKGTKITGSKERVSAYSCGPVSMLKAISGLFSSHSIPCQMALEELMPCGFGICMGCTVKTKMGNDFVYKRVCKDGPVFNSKEIIWED